MTVMENLLQKYNDHVSNLNKAWAMIKDRKERACESALKGLIKRDFRKLVGHEFSILFSTNSNRWDTFRSAYFSFHGTTTVCWTESERAFVQGYCDTAKGYYFTRTP